MGPVTGGRWQATLLTHSDSPANPAGKEGLTGARTRAAVGSGRATVGQAPQLLVGLCHGRCLLLWEEAALQSMASATLRKGALC